MSKAKSKNSVRYFTELGDEDLRKTLGRVKDKKHEILEHGRWVEASDDTWFSVLRKAADVESELEKAVAISFGTSADTAQMSVTKIGNAWVGVAPEESCWFSTVEAAGRWFHEQGAKLGSGKIFVRENLVGDTQATEVTDLEQFKAFSSLLRAVPMSEAAAAELPDSDLAARIKEKARLRKGNADA